MWAPKPELVKLRCKSFAANTTVQVKEAFLTVCMEVQMFLVYME